MADFNFDLGGLGVPMTLSSIGTKFVYAEWEKVGYRGYQITPELLIGDASKVQTPLGLHHTRGIGLVLPKFIGNYKGGRNESFMYGFDRDIYLYDYDLTSAYTTVLFNIGHPDYSRGDFIDQKRLEDMSDVELLFSYTIISCHFIYNSNVKYPGIPVYVDKTTTVYPSEGEALLTGAEYILARNQNCVLNIHDIYHIPFILSVEDIRGDTGDPVIDIQPKDSTENIEINLEDVKNIHENSHEKDEHYNQDQDNSEGLIAIDPNLPLEKRAPTQSEINEAFPFKNIIKTVQAKRREFAKGTISNLMYKEIGNSIYGSLVRGMADKKRFDNRTREMMRLPAHKLSNPLLASWITGFIRGIIGECLQAIHDLDGVIISVTTDGFITDIKDLEVKMTGNKKYFLFNQFKTLRDEISGNKSGLEIKHEGAGIITWSTRGQLGVHSKIIATTGFQNRAMKQDWDEMVELFINTMSSKGKKLEFMQAALRGPIDITKHGGHVTMVYSDRGFAFRYDLRRKLTTNDDGGNLANNKASKDVNNVNENDESNKSIGDFNLMSSKTKFASTLLDSEPVPNAHYAANLRYISRRSTAIEYSPRTSLTASKSKHKNILSTAVRQFVKIIYTNDPGYIETYPEVIKMFKYSSLQGVVNFINKYEDGNVKLTPNYIAVLRNRKIIFKQVPRTKETLAFVKYRCARKLLFLILMKIYSSENNLLYCNTPLFFRSLIHSFIHSINH